MAMSGAVPQEKGLQFLTLTVKSALAKRTVMPTMKGVETIVEKKGGFLSLSAANNLYDPTCLMKLSSRQNKDLQLTQKALEEENYSSKQYTTNAAAAAVKSSLMQMG